MGNPPRTSPHYGFVKRRYYAILQGQPVKPADQYTKHALKGQARLADVLAALKKHPQPPQAFRVLTPHEHLACLRAHDIYLDRQGHWPDPFQASNSAAREIVRKSWQEGPRRAHLLFAATHPCLYITIDFEDLMHSLGHDLSNDPKYMWDPGVQKTIRERMGRLLRSSYFYTLEISDTGKLHFEIVYDGITQIPKARKGEIITTPAQLLNRLVYLHKPKYPIPGARHNRSAPQTHREILTALSIVGMHDTHGKQLTQKKPHRQRSNRPTTRRWDVPSTLDEAIRTNPHRPTDPSSASVFDAALHHIPRLLPAKDEWIGYVLRGEKIPKKKRGGEKG